MFIPVEPPIIEHTVTRTNDELDSVRSRITFYTVYAVIGIYRMNEVI